MTIGDELWEQWRKTSRLLLVLRESLDMLAEHPVPNEHVVAPVRETLKLMSKTIREQRRIERLIIGV